MIQQQARVLEVQQDRVRVSTVRQSACQSCNAKGGCGTSLIGQLFPERPAQQFWLSAGGLSELPSVGDQVLIGIDEHYLQNATLMLYALPLLGLLGGAVAGAWLGAQAWSPLPAEPMSILMCALGLLGGLRLVRRHGRARERRLGQAVKLLRIERAAAQVGVPFAMPGKLEN